MSRIGKQPVVIPAGVKVQVGRRQGARRGPQGQAGVGLPPQHEGRARRARPRPSRVTRPDDERLNRALHGLTRSLIANMVEGVTKGYEKRLKIEGIGYQARMDKKTRGADGRLRQRRRDDAAGGRDGGAARSDDHRRHGGGQAEGGPVRGRGAPRPASRSRTRARAFATRTNRCAARKASPSPAAVSDPRSEMAHSAIVVESWSVMDHQKAKQRQQLRRRQHVRQQDRRHRGAAAADASSAAPSTFTPS